MRNQNRNDSLVSTHVLCNMQSQLFTDMYHLEDNVYCNDDLMICRLYKLVIVFFKSQNVFAFYLLKQSKEVNVASAMMTLLYSDDPEPILKKLIGVESPQSLPCKIEEYEIQLIPKGLGNYDILITYETQSSLASRNALEQRACIVYLNDFFDINPVKLFRLLSSSASPNVYAKTDLVLKLKNLYEDVPSQQILLMSHRSLYKNMKYLPHQKQDVTIHLLCKDRYYKPEYPGINFTVIYMDEDKHMAEPLLPTNNSLQPQFVVKKLSTLEGFY